MEDERELLFDRGRDVVLLPGCKPTTRLRPIGHANDVPKPVERGGPGNVAAMKDSTKGWTAVHVYHMWRSRDNRKGRHTIAVVSPKKLDKSRLQPDSYLIPPRSSHYASILKNTKRMFTQCPYWDVSYLVAVVFTLGSAIWMINSFFVWLPLVKPSTKFKNEENYGGGITALLGVLVFELGAVLLMFEAFNENRSYCFGWAIERAIEDEEKAGGEMARLVSEVDDLCTHHHRRKRRKNDTRKYSWVWMPSWHDWKTHFLHEIGFLACFTEFIGATVFATAGFTALPGIHNNLKSQWALNGAYWIPQVVGGCGFIISSLLFMLETQKKWWKPAPLVLGYWIGFWNLIGSIGFTLSGAIGMWPGSGGEYQAGCATFWGSWAFLIGSVLQWYESLEKYPVTKMKDNGSDEASD